MKFKRLAELLDKEAEDNARALTPAGYTTLRCIARALRAYAKEQRRRRNPQVR